MLVRDAISRPINESKTDETGDKLSRGDGGEGRKSQAENQVNLDAATFNRPYQDGTRRAIYGFVNDDNACNANNAARMEM